MAIRSTRRTFLRAAPLAAAVALTSSDTLLHAATGQVPAAPEPYQLFPAATLESKTQALHAKPGNDNLFSPKSLPVTIVLTVEEKKSAKEFEWHEGRDHIVQILEGSTVYEIGGTPRDGHNTKPGEWLAPAAEGSTRMILKKGDMLVIPRNTLHKRSTEGSVTFTLISTTGTV
jgi:mannose-6-phosphate isomerase-like protein (cupin superfamily)